MQIVIENTGNAIAMSHLVSSNARTDLIPVPANLEMTVKLNDELEKELKEGAVLLVGADHIRMTIVKVAGLNTQVVVDNKRVRAVSIIAVLAGCETLIDPLSKAVILDNINFAAAYRACGCKLKFDKDIPLLQFAAAYGSIPTFEIARCLQEESAMIYLNKNKLSVQRLDAFFKQDPVLTLDNGSVAWINNPKIEQTQTPNFVSVSEDGAMVSGNQKLSKSPVQYYPNADSRRLKNLNKILITRGTATRSMDMTIQAGDVFLIDNIKYLVLTAVHCFKSGALGGGTVAASRFWLATLSN